MHMIIIIHKNKTIAYWKLRTRLDCILIKLTEFQNVSGRIMSGNLISVFIATVLIISVYNVQSSDHHFGSTGEFFLTIPPVVCTILGYTLYFSGVSMFIWMTLLSYDLACSINELKIPEEKNSQIFTGKFSKFAMVGAGVPLFMTFAILVMDQSELTETLPGVGKDCCFLTMSGIY